jgi:hypothetical protein
MAACWPWSSVVALGKLILSYPIVVPGKLILTYPIMLPGRLILVYLRWYRVTEGCLDYLP